MDSRGTSPQRVYRSNVDDDTQETRFARSAIDRSGSDGHGSDSDSDRRRPRTPLSAPKRNRLVITIGVVLGLIGLTVIGWFAGLLVGKVFGTDDANALGGAGPSTSVTAGAAPAASSGPSAAAAAQIPVTSAALFDPLPGDGQENPDRIGLAHDGNPGTFWPTLQYNGTPAFGNIKPGVGLVFDLGSEQLLASVKVATSLPGAAVDIRTGPDGATSLEQYAVVSPVQTLAGETTFPVTAGTKARFVLVWISQLVDSNGTFQANLAEVTFST